jgi:hypothetical protein
MSTVLLLQTRQQRANRVTGDQVEEQKCNRERAENREYIDGKASQKEAQPYTSSHKISPMKKQTV